ncbi:MAG: FG-GAP-like repeat-containing protein, partial [Bacteroidota bacterium]
LRDIYITNGYKKDITDMDFVDFNNNATKFGTLEKRRAILVEQLEKMEGVKKSNFFFTNMGGNHFANQTDAMGLTHPSYTNGAVYADLDLDGDLDMVGNNLDAEVLLFENLSNAKRAGEANYLRIAMDADARNLGAKVWVYTKDTLNYAEFYPQRGYLSSMEPALHFGVKTAQRVDSIRILWPDNRTLLLRDVGVNQVLTPLWQESLGFFIGEDRNQVGQSLFATMENGVGLDYVHSENTFNDFKKWPLHFRSYSRPGPVMDSGDVNGDGRMDVFLGGSANHLGKVYVQGQEGIFREEPLVDSLSLSKENSACLFFDADGDGDLDLYSGYGSSENYAFPERYEDVLYLNDGEGKFSAAMEKLPKMKTPTGAVTSLDYDKDGDLDLFIGGRLDPSGYPKAPKSYLLRNDQGTFTEVTETVGPELRAPGMVTDALSTDVNGDGWVDLVLVGEWMPIQVYYNKQGNFVLDKTRNGLATSNGWWNTIRSADFDGDGDSDFVVGNWGLNNPFKASTEEPLSLYAKDYDGNGTIEPIFTHFVQGKEHIVHPRGTLIGQLPVIRKLANSYSSYGKMAFSELWGDKDFDEDEVFRTYTLASVYMENLGDGKFRLRDLPDLAQWSPLFDMEIGDVNEDAFPDVLGVGNFYGTEVLTGHYDAGLGVCLLGNGNGTFTPLDAVKSGFKVNDEAREILGLTTAKGEELWLIGLQNDSLGILRKNK